MMLFGVCSFMKLFVGVPFSVGVVIKRGKRLPIQSLSFMNAYHFTVFNSSLLFRSVLNKNFCFLLSVRFCEFVYVYLQMGF